MKRRTVLKSAAAGAVVASLGGIPARAAFAAQPNTSATGLIAASGWNTWDITYHSGVVQLPSKVLLRFALYDGATGLYSDDFTWHQGLAALGPHASDGSYCSVGLSIDRPPTNVIDPQYLTTPDGERGLRGEFFNDTDLTGDPVLTRTDTTLDFDWGSGSPGPGVNAMNWSARWTGTLTPPTSGDYQFALTSDDGSRLYIDGNLIIDNWGVHASQTVTGTAQLTTGSAVDITVEYFQGGGGANLTLESPELSTSRTQPIDPYLTTPDGDPGLLAEFFNDTDLTGDPVLTRTDTTLDFDWGSGSPGPGVNSMNWSARWTGTLTPPTSGDYQFALTSDDGSRLYIDGNLIIDNWGVHASQTVIGTAALTAGSAADFRVEYFQGGGGANLTLDWAPPGSEPLTVTFNAEFGAPDQNTTICQLTPVEHSAQLLLIARLDGAWQANVAASRSGDTLRATAGGQDWVISASRAPAPTPASLAGQPVLAFSFDAPVLLVGSPASGVFTGSAAATLRGLRDKEAADRLSSSGWLADSVEGMQRAITWNTVFEPNSSRIVTPVSRDFFSNRTDPVVFEWDNFFCSLMAMSFDRELSRVNFQVVLDYETPQGFVPNLEFPSSGGATPTPDRSEPPVGAYCLLKAYRASGLGADTVDSALLASVYEKIRNYHEWWFTARDGNNDGLLEWGSNGGDLQAAKYESGLDNSPMYDDAVFNTTTHTMQLTDVGLNALYAADAWAIAAIAQQLGRSDDADRFTTEYQTIAKRVNDVLWNEQLGIYLNRDWNGNFSTRISPTNFYPLLAGIAPHDRAARMVNGHLLNNQEFLSTYMLSSIASDDPAFNDQNYWRGRVWGPMNFLVYEGLRRYGFHEAATTLADHGLRAFLPEWQTKNHVHENYNGVTAAGEDPLSESDPLYTWGGLLAYCAAAEIATAQPWDGWSFGETQAPPATVRNIRIAEGLLGVTVDGSSLDVRLDDKRLLTCPAPVAITGYRRESGRIHFTAAARPGTNTSTATLTVGLLPAQQLIAIQVNGHTRRARTDDAGQIAILLRLPTDVDIQPA